MPSIRITSQLSRSQWYSHGREIKKKMTLSPNRYCNSKLNNYSIIISSRRMPFMFTTFFHDAPFGRSNVGRRDKRIRGWSLSHFMQNETEFAHQLSIAWIFVKKVKNIVQRMSFDDWNEASYQQRNCRRPVDTIGARSGFRPFQCRRQGAAQHSLELASIC